MIDIDYTKLEKMLEIKGISRRKLAKDTEISENSIAGSFRRRSKMKTAYLVRIANYFNVSPLALLKTDSNGEANPSDIEQLETFQQANCDIDSIIEDFDIDTMIDDLRKLTQEGRMKVADFIDLVLKIPSYRKDKSQNESGEG